jgi:hypothetical protein
MSFTQDFRTQRRNFDDGNIRIHDKDRLWYDGITNTIRISDGQTPGGLIVAGGGGAGSALTWKTWQVAGQQSLIAVGEDTVSFVAGANISITTNAISKTITFSSDGGTSAGNIYAQNAMVDRGTDQLNWNTLTTMGIYLVNRVSWSGTTGTPTDSMNYTGILEVLNSGSTVLTQNYRPYDASIVVKNFWTRTKFSTNSWSSWVEVTNNTSWLDGGSY